HLGLDHPWLKQRPELFVQSQAKQPGTFHEHTVFGPRWLAHGRDPNFAPWADTAQLDYRSPMTRAAVIEELKSVARRCDGIRCDMAMLLLKDVFARTWAEFPPISTAAKGTTRTATCEEFWAEAIRNIKTHQSDCLFLAEAYWDLEPRLV